MARGRIGKSLTGAFVVLALIAVSAARAQTASVDRPMLETLHEAGQGFRHALADPNASVAAVDDARQRLEHETGRLAGRGTGSEDRRIVELYAAAAHGYQEARNRFGTDHSREHFLADLKQIETELAEADNLFQGSAPIIPAVAPAPPPPVAPRKRAPEQTVPVPPSDLAPPAPVPPPMPPAHSPEPPTHATPPTSPPAKHPSQSTPPPPAAEPPAPPVAPPSPAASNVVPAPPARTAPPPPPAAPPKPVSVPEGSPQPATTAEPAPPPNPAVVPPAPPPPAPAPPARIVPPPPVPPAVTEPRPAVSVAPAPPAPPPSIAPPAHVVPPPPVPPAATRPPAATAPPHEPAGPQRVPPIVSRAPIPTTPNGVRKAADRVRIEKSAGAVVDRCSLLGEVATGDVRSGVHEIGGHNFLYEDALGLARLMTVEAGGDTLLVRDRNKTSVTGDAYRCSSKP